MAVVGAASGTSSVPAPAPVYALQYVMTRAPLAAPPETPPPAALTSGHPDPATIQAQKDNYVNSLDEQLRQGAGALNQQVKEQRESVRMQAEQQKAIFATQVDQEMRLAEVQVEHRFASQVKDLKHQAMQQRAMLEHQALQLSMEFQGRKAEEDMLQQHHHLFRESQTLHEHLRALPNLTAAYTGNPLLASSQRVASVTPTPSHVPPPLSGTMSSVPSVMVVPPTGVPAAPGYYIQTAPTVMVPMSTTHVLSA
eukprot:TRINITY_DN69290_c0_g1_i1.p1 TRINITY_DN69290_c0_g1~~TRINITY_DN69290_c0_g1_i1.p1  ORF type:complete len:292 (-),score=45.44 TRINITY_DN69290_c0_g1_i1:343-1101(-)